MFNPMSRPFFFDGSGDYVVIPETPGFESENHTIMLWFFSEHVRFGDCISKDSWGGGRQWLFETRDQKTVIFHVWTDAGLASAETGVALEDNRWYHLAQRWDGQSLDFFIDGVLVASKSHSGQLNSGNSPVRIGGGAITDDQYGHEDEVQIWSRALSASEINDYMMCRPAPGTENLEGLWTFENVVDGVVPDLSGNERHGTIQGNAVASSLVPSLECQDWVAGCTDSNACNYDPIANFDDGSCVSCDLVASFCGLGTIWDPNTQTCIGDGSGDINLDGCVQLNDLLDLLSAYGNCGAGESAWQCGEDLEYGGDNYGTIQIGEQCWFSENLRSNYYSDGSLVESIQNNSNWANGNVGMICTYGNVASNEELYGSLYNWHAVADVRGLCPTGWHVPEEVEWQGLLGSAGGAAVAGQTLKAQDFWAAGAQGNDALGFDGRPGGYRRYDGTYKTLGSKGYWWTSTAVNDGQATIFELNSTAAVATYPDLINGGFSVRCIQNAE